MAGTGRPTIADVLVERLGADVARFDEAGRGLSRDGARGVHQLRVACRRLRGDLRLFRGFLEPERAERLRGDLKQVADALGPARDLGVHRRRIADLVSDGSPPEALLPALADVDRLLAARERRAMVRALAVVEDGTYRAVRSRLRRAVRTPPTTASAQQPAVEVLPGLVYAVWRPMNRRLGRLDSEADAEAWHQARIRAKQTRYAAECSEPVIGKRARRLADAAQSLQDHLGAHQDAVVAARTVTALATDRRVRPSTAEGARWLAAREEAELARFRGDLRPVHEARRRARAAAKALRR